MACISLKLYTGFKQTGRGVEKTMNRDGENMILDAVRERIRRPGFGKLLKWVAVTVGAVMLILHFRK